MYRSVFLFVTARAKDRERDLSTERQRAPDRETASQRAREKPFILPATCRRCAGRRHRGRERPIERDSEPASKKQAFFILPAICRRCAGGRGDGASTDGVAERRGCSRPLRSRACRLRRAAGGPPKSRFSGTPRAHTCPLSVILTQSHTHAISTPLVPGSRRVSRCHLERMPSIWSGCGRWYGRRDICTAISLVRFIPPFYGHR